MLFRSFNEVHSEVFLNITQALNYTQFLRNDGNQHVVMSSDIIGNMTKPGVAEVNPGYDWKKRRS